MAKLIAAVVQAAPVLFHRRETTAKVVGLIADAARSGARLIVFPETMIPGYVNGLGTTAKAFSDELAEAYQMVLENAVTISGPEVKQISAAAAKARAWVAVGVQEVDAERRNSVYNTLLAFAPSGDLVLRHRKLVPTHHERLVWTPGDGSDLKVVDTDFGRMGGLICWENMMPLARFTLYAQGVEIYLAPTADDAAGWLDTIRHIAREGGCFVLSACPVIRLADVPSDHPIRPMWEQSRVDFLERGGSAIIAPAWDPVFLAGPVYEREETLLAEIDLGRLRRWRLLMDPAGHYNRTDVFELVIHDQPKEPLVHRAAG
jgi:nitrilase